MNPNSVLLFRYVIGIPILAAIMQVRNVSFRLHKEEILPVAILGILMAISSLTLFASYNYMNSGIASTLLFIYPIMVAVMMIFFFHEKFKISVVCCLLVMCAGLALLLKPQGDNEVSIVGVLLVALSALTYALYIVFTNVSHIIRAIPTTKLLFYVLCFGSMLYLVMIPLGFELRTPAVQSGWLSLIALAAIPTVLSLACTTRAIQLIGSTSTAIFGALEPISAVLLSVCLLGQSITPRDIMGGLLIVIATLMVIAEKPVDKFILHVRKMFPRHPAH